MLNNTQLQDNKVLREDISYEQIFPNKPGFFYLEKWGILCKAEAEGTKVVMTFDCSHITGGRVMAELTSRMMGVRFESCRKDLETLVVTIDMAQFVNLDKRVKKNYKGQYIRIGG